MLVLILLSTIDSESFHIEIAKRVRAMAVFLGPKKRNMICVLESQSHDTLINLGKNKAVIFGFALSHNSFHITFSQNIFFSLLAAQPRHRTSSWPATASTELWLGPDKNYKNIWKSLL